jgi:REP element-mobilizing transposase RayT
LDKNSVAAGFSLREKDVVDIFTNMLGLCVTKQDCIVPVYCFMPDHQHLIIQGTRGYSDLWKTVVSYKQKTGFWMSVNKPEMKWQKDFYDRIIRGDDDIAAQIRYILDNPVRKGLVTLWQQYPFKGAIGCKLEDMLCGIM